MVYGQKANSEIVNADFAAKNSEDSRVKNPAIFDESLQLARESQCDMYAGASSPDSANPSTRGTTNGAPNISGGEMPSAGKYQSAKYAFGADSQPTVDEEKILEDLK